MPQADGSCRHCCPEETHQYFLYLMMDTTIRRGTKSVVINQSFAPPQGTQDTTHPNNTVHIIYGYVGDGPMTMSAKEFKVEIVDHNGYDVPCTIEAPIFSQARATLNPDNLYPMVQR